MAVPRPSSFRYTEHPLLVEYHASNSENLFSITGKLSIEVSKFDEHKMIYLIFQNTRRRHESFIADTEKCHLQLDELTRHASSRILFI
jgi:hypothetical protein